MRVGITFGCFIPLHKGHMSMIQEAFDENDMIIVGVCGYENDRGKDFIPFEKRYGLISQIFAGNPAVKVIKIDDKKLGLDGTFTLKNWELWCEELFKNARFDPNGENIRYTWYSGEGDYLKKIQLLYPHHQFELLDRKEINISGTEIRKDPVKYENMIHPVFSECLHNFV